MGEETRPLEAPELSEPRGAPPGWGEAERPGRAREAGGEARPTRGRGRAGPSRPGARPPPPAGDLGSPTPWGQAPPAPGRPLRPPAWVPRPGSPSPERGHCLGPAGAAWFRPLGPARRGGRGPQWVAGEGRGRGAAGRRVAGGARAGRGRSRGRRRRCPEPGAGAAVAAAEPGCLERAPGRGGLNGPPGPRRAGTDPPWDPRPRRPLSRVAFGHPPGAPAPFPLPAPRSRPDHDPGPSSYSLGRSSSPWGRIPGEGAPIPWSCVSVTREETQPKFLLSHIVKLENMPGTSSHAPAPPALPGGCARPATLVALRAGGQGR